MKGIDFSTPVTRIARYFLIVALNSEVISLDKRLYHQHFPNIASLSDLVIIIRMPRAFI